MHGLQLAKDEAAAKDKLESTETQHEPGKEPFRRFVLPPHVMEMLLQVRA